MARCAAENTMTMQEAKARKCVFCLSEKVILKILSCMHLACGSCAEEHLRFNNSIRCANCQAYTTDPGPGRILSKWLVDWPTEEQQTPDAAPSLGSSDRSNLRGTSVCISDGDGGVSLDCIPDDDVGEDEDAEYKTKEAIGLGSPLVTPTENANSWPGIDMGTLIKSEFCPLHSGKIMAQYCQWCDFLMCEKCLAQSDHKWHDTETIVEAEVLVRAELRSISETSSDKEEKLEELISSIDKDIEAANDNAEAESEAISADFDMHREVLNVREASLKQSVDEHRWKVVKKL